MYCTTVVVKADGAGRVGEKAIRGPDERPERHSDNLCRVGLSQG